MLPYNQTPPPDYLLAGGWSSAAHRPPRGPRPGRSGQPTQRQALARRSPPSRSRGCRRARGNKGGIGYVKIAFFPGVNGQRFARELDRALGGIRECTRLIVDLRGNLGGFVGSLRLMSYLTPDQVPVG